MEYHVTFAISKDEPLDLLPIYLNEAIDKLKEATAGKTIIGTRNLYGSYSDIVRGITYYKMSIHANE